MIRRYSLLFSGERGRGKKTGPPDYRLAEKLSLLNII